MPTLTIPNTFSPATTILSADVNADLAAIATFVNSTKLDQDNIQTGGVSSANLAALSVTAAKLASDAVTTAKILDANVTTAKIADANVTTAKILDANVTTAKLADVSVTAAKIANATITGTQVSSNINLPGDAVKADGKNVVVCQTNSGTNAHSLIRGHVNSGGAADIGEGFTASKLGTGSYSVSFTTAFSATPVVTASPEILGMCRVFGVSTTGFFADFLNSSLAAADTAFQFIAIGIR